MLEAVLGGTAASHTCSGVGGGHFLINRVVLCSEEEQREQPPLKPKPRRGIEPGVGSLILSARSALAAGALVGAQAGALLIT